MTDPTVDDTPPHDPQAIERLRRWGGETLVREMAEIFRRDIPRRLAEARDAIGAGDRVSLERHAHSTKSSCGQLGAPRMQRLAAELEEASAGGAPDRLVSLLDAVEAGFVEHAAWLQTFSVEDAS